MEIKIQLESDIKRLELFGPTDKHLRMLRDKMDVKITARNGDVTITGQAPKVKAAARIIDKMQKHLIERGSLSSPEVGRLIEQNLNKVDPKKTDALVVYSHKGIIEPFTKGQLNYIKTMLKNDLTFCIGPAGTGKTYLAVAVAVAMLKKKQIKLSIKALQEPPEPEVVEFEEEDTTPALTAMEIAYRKALDSGDDEDSTVDTTESDNKGSSEQDDIIARTLKQKAAN